MSFFGGFAKSVGRNLLQMQQEETEREQQNRNIQLDLLIKQANDPTLKSEYKPVIMDQIVNLIGKKGGQGKKGKQQFEEGLKGILEMFEPAETSMSWNEPTGVLPAAPAAEGIPYPAGPGGETRFKFPELPGRNLAKDIPVLERRTETRIGASPFYTSDEMLQRKIAEEEAIAKARHSFGRGAEEDKSWRLLGDTFRKPDGTRMAVQINEMTGARREIQLPEGVTEQEWIAQIRAQEKANRSGADYAKLLNTTAVQMAAANEPLGTEVTDEAVYGKYLQRAGAYLIEKGEATLENIRAGIEYRRAGTQATRANMPQPGQPTAATQRSFSQLTTQINELEKQLAAGTKDVKSLIGTTLKDGTVLDINLPTEKLLKLIQRKITELSQDVDRLKKERAKAPVTSPPTRGVGEMFNKSVGGTTRLSPNMGERWTSGHRMSMPDGSTWEITGPPGRDGKYPAKRVN